MYLIYVFCQQYIPYGILRVYLPIMELIEPKKLTPKVLDNFSLRSLRIFTQLVMNIMSSTKMTMSIIECPFLKISTLWSVSWIICWKDASSESILKVFLLTFTHIWNLVACILHLVVFVFQKSRWIAPIICRSRGPRIGTHYVCPLLFSETASAK